MSRRQATSMCLLAVVVTLTRPVVGQACSVFAIRTDEGPVYGQNLDWHEWFPGHVVINVRGVDKTVLDWKGHWPTSSQRDEVSWTSRYGSVTFTCYGRDFIDGGMNEAGLVVDETNLTAVYPPADERAGVSCTQWMQYQLDSFATVGEVIDHLDDLRPDGEGWHYLVADAEGGGAVIEYRGGEPLIYRGDDLPVWAISNTSYTQGLSHLPMDRAFGGKIDIAAGDDAYGRFLRMTILLESYETLDVPGSDYAFAVLDSVGSELTRRSVVYDGPSGRIMWRTKSNPSVRWLDLASIDFSADQPTRFVDIESKGSGDVSDEIVAYTTEANRRLVRSVLGLKASDRVRSLLSERGLTYEEALELIALHPTRQTASSAPD